MQHGIRLALAGVLTVGALAFGAGNAAANARAVTGTFSDEDQFVVEPGDPSSCSFPVSFDLQVHGSFQELLDSHANPTSMIVHEIWSGTGSANDKYVIEHAAQTDLINLVTGANSNVGAIHDQLPFGGVLIHDVGILSFDGSGNLTFEAGQHQGFDGDPAAIAAFCSALT